MTAKVDRVGHRYGRLSVLREVEPKVHPGGCVSLHWLCICDCGTEKTVSGKALATGLTISCGCASVERAKELHRTHGLSKTAEYSIWRGMVDRCDNPNGVAWSNYGGRGIKVCDEWRHDFPAFLAHIGARPGPEYSVDRIDNDRGYEPGNVRWATIDVQANNRRKPQPRPICGRGHVLAEVGVYIQKKTGIRFCKACRDIREARRPPRTKKRAA